MAKTIPLEYTGVKGRILTNEFIMPPARAEISAMPIGA
jgi:hypothetical protein